MGGGPENEMIHLGVELSPWSNDRGSSGLRGVDWLVCSQPTPVPDVGCRNFGTCGKYVSAFNHVAYGAEERDTG